MNKLNNKNEYEFNDKDFNEIEDKLKLLFSNTKVEKENLENLLWKLPVTNNLDNRYNNMKGRNKFIINFINIFMSTKTKIVIPSIVAIVLIFGGVLYYNSNNIRPELAKDDIKVNIDNEKVDTINENIPDATDNVDDIELALALEFKDELTLLEEEDYSYYNEEDFINSLDKSYEEIKL